MLLSKSPKHCPCAVAQEDTWEHIMSFCIPHELCMIACSAPFLRKLADKSESWYYLCQVLWRNKQYHPLERWVRLKPTVDPRVKRRTLLERFQEEQSVVTILSEKICGFEKQKESLLDEIKLISSEDSKSCLAKKEMLNMIDGQMATCSNYREIVMAKLERLKQQLEIDNGESSSAVPVCQERLACPISRAVRADWIRLENEYFSTLESRDVAEAKLSVLSNGAAASSTNSYNKILSNQVVFDTLLNQVTQLQHRADNLKQQINKNLSRKVNISVELANAAANGTLLSWKESYRASLADYKRTSITAEELREMGECAAYLKGSPTLQTIRFIRGGHCIIDNNSFKNSMGWFEINGNEFSIPQLASSGLIDRVESDWGWQFSCHKGINRIASYDRSRGFDQHQGALSHQKDGSRSSAPQELTGGGLLSGSHPVGLYCLESV